MTVLKKRIGEIEQFVNIKDAASANCYPGFVNDAAFIGDGAGLYG